MDYWSKEESKRSESIIALILEEIKHSILKKSILSSSNIMLEHS